MRLMIPIPYYRHGGVERVLISLISQLSEQIEQIIIISSPQIINHFQKLLPNSQNIVYESSQLIYNSKQSKIIGIIDKILVILKQTKIEFLMDYFQQVKNDYISNSRLKEIINKYQATHCLYVIANRINPPKIKIPLSVIIHDLFWHFAPLTYSEEYTKPYDNSLLQWLKKANKILTVSQKTKDDILSIFPQFVNKIIPIPNAGFLGIEKINPENNLANQITIFYFPSSFGIYKDHLSLLKAGLILAKKELNFKIVLIGKETDKFIQGKLSLSQQNQTKEYVDYLTECQSLYQTNQELINKHFIGLGYCENEEVEKWYQAANCIVFPSKYEGFGLALSEAIVRGMPVIASDLEVFYEQVELYQCSDLVEFFPKGNAEILAEKMAQFILNPIPKLPENEIKNRFHHWTWTQVAQEYIKVMLN